MVQDVLENHKGPKIINRKLQGGRQLMSYMKDNNGTETRNKPQISQIVKHFYSTLYSSDQPDWRSEEDWSSRSEEVPPILPEEVSHDLRKMKNGKAPGEDQVTSDILSLGDDETITTITTLFNKILQEEEIIIFKKGDKKTTDLSAYYLTCTSFLPELFLLAWRSSLTIINQESRQASDQVFELQTTYKH